MTKKISVSIFCKDPDYFPIYATPGAAGADLRANLDEEVTLQPGESRLIPTGIFIEIPNGYEAQVRPRSGLALKYGITLLNSPGTIDADYRGEVCVILIHHGKEVFTVTPKMRIAQLVISPVEQVEFQLRESLTYSKRGVCGFGHTGVH